MNKEDLLLMVIAAAQDKGLTPIQLQKALFLVGQEMPAHWKDFPEDFYSFEPYHYGPFDPEIYDDALYLTEEGLVHSLPSKKGRWNESVITIVGTKRAEELKDEVPQHLSTWVGEVVEWTQSLSFAALVRAIYARYPTYQENSIFRG